MSHDLIHGQVASGVVNLFNWPLSHTGPGNDPVPFVGAIRIDPGGDDLVATPPQSNIRGPLCFAHPSGPEGAPGPH